MQTGEVRVDVRVADVDVALGGEALAHGVEVVLPADERERDAVPGPGLLLVGARAIRRAPDDEPGVDELAHELDGHGPRRLTELHRPVDVDADHDHDASVTLKYGVEGRM